MTSDIQKFLNWLCRVDFPEGELRFDDILLDGAVAVLGKDPLAAEAFVEANAPRFWRRTCQHADDAEAVGLTPTLEIIDRTARWAVAKRPLSQLRGNERRIRTRARSRPAILREIDSLTNGEYEALGCLVARFAGADRVALTPAGGEGGVDFFARLRQPGRTHLFSGMGAPIRIVGQAKMHADPVGVDLIREFFTSIQAVCHQSPEVESHVPPWFRASGGPVVGWILGHSGFQGGAERQARNFGVLCSNSLDLAEVAAHSRMLDEGLEGELRARMLGTRARDLVAATTEERARAFS